MPNSKRKRQINVDRELYEKFEYMYPELTSIFINRAMKLALQDKKIFEEIFLNKLFVEVK